MWDFREDFLENDKWHLLQGNIFEKTDGTIDFFPFYFCELLGK